MQISIMAGRVSVKLLFVVLCVSLPLSLFLTSRALLRRVNCAVLWHPPLGIVHSPETLSSEDFSKQYLSLSDRVESLRPGEKLVEAFFNYLDGKRGFTVRKTVLIAVITTGRYLLTRVQAIHKTWAQDIDSDSELYYFVGEDCDTEHPLLKDLPIIKLKGVHDDVYPPQKKVFSVLAHLQSAFGERFKWFVRADDDVYIRMGRLKSLLGRLDWTEKLYMGRPGLGKKEDRQRLKLLSHENYCMGGTGVVLSAAALEAVSPHLGFCLKAVEVYNSRWGRDMWWYNEDVELGRCVSRTLGIGCSSLSEFFPDHKSEALNSSLLWTKKIFRGVTTIHPVKKPENIFIVHHFYTTVKLGGLVVDTQKAQFLLNTLCGELSTHNTSTIAGKCPHMLLGNG